MTFLVMSYSNQVNINIYADLSTKFATISVIDINTIPGLHPEYSYLPRMAEEFGLGYKGLIKAIMDDN